MLADGRASGILGGDNSCHHTLAEWLRGHRARRGLDERDDHTGLPAGRGPTIPSFDIQHSGTDRRAADTIAMRPVRAQGLQSIDPGRCVDLVAIREGALPAGRRAFRRFGSGIEADPAPSPWPPRRRQGDPQRSVNRGRSGQLAEPWPHTLEHSRQRRLGRERLVGGAGLARPGRQLRNPNLPGPRLHPPACAAEAALAWRRPAAAEIHADPPNLARIITDPENGTRPGAGSRSVLRFARPFPPDRPAPPPEVPKDRNSLMAEG